MVLSSGMLVDIVRLPQSGKRGSKMNETIENDDIQQSTYRVTSAELRSFVERFERLEIEKKDIADQQKEVMAEAKSRGYDTKILRKIVVLRKKDPQEISEEEAVLDMYKEALGM